jgi:hypothetical protein
MAPDCYTNWMPIQLQAFALIILFVSSVFVFCASIIVMIGERRFTIRACLFATTAICLALGALAALGAFLSQLNAHAHRPPLRAGDNLLRG